MSKIRRTPTEVRLQVADQLDLLIAYCKQFDGGTVLMGKPIATALRVLFYSSPNRKSRSIALLDQAGLRSGRWLDIAGPLNPERLESSCGLVAFRVEAQTCVAPTAFSGARAWCEPKFANSEPVLRYVPFPEWWTDAIARNATTKKVFSRMDIVAHVANTDGGAHVDAEIDDTYAALAAGDFISVRAVVGTDYFGLNVREGGAGQVIPGAHLAALRTIAHETLVSLLLTAPELFREPYLTSSSPVNYSQGIAVPSQPARAA